MSPTVHGQLDILEEEVGGGEKAYNYILHLPRYIRYIFDLIADLMYILQQKIYKIYNDLCDPCYPCLNAPELLVCS